MASERMERKLAAILAVDVVGYSRMTGAGDGVIDDFRSVVDAVRCAS